MPEEYEGYGTGQGPRVREIELPGGHRVLAAVRVLDPALLPDGAYDEDGFDDVAAAPPERIAARVERFNELVAGVGATVLEAARAAQPDEVSATFGVEIGVTAGKAVSWLAEAGAKGTLAVTLTWRPAPPSPPPAGQRTAAAQGGLLPEQAPPGAGSAGSYGPDGTPGQQ